MTTFNRWCVVALLALAVVGLPFVVRALPVGDDDVDAAGLLERIEASEERGYSGYVETLGTLDLPVADGFTDIAGLFGERTRLRVWWRGPDTWRVDKLLATGETDLVHDGPATTEWSYERDRAETSLDPEIRLPRTSDLTPPMVAQRVLRDVDESELARLPARRVAGRDALGLRLVPGAPQSSVEHVDVWADRDTGVPLLVEVYGAEPEAAFTSEFREFSDDDPRPGLGGVLPARGRGSRLRRRARHRRRGQPVRALPAPGGDRRAGAVDDTRGAVGVYGQGVTRVLAIPVRGQEAAPLREKLRGTFGVEQVPQGTVVSIGPLGVLLTGECEDGGWLVTGAVTEDTLLAAADDLAAVAAQPRLPEGGQ